jgi:hypothetical protein
LGWVTVCGPERRARDGRRYASAADSGGLAEHQLNDVAGGLGVRVQAEVAGVVEEALAQGDDAVGDQVGSSGDV